MSVYIIAEIGVNHNGNLQTAFELIKSAKDLGANCVKFQTYKTENLVSKTSPKASYQFKLTDKNESQFEMLKKLELSDEDFYKIIKYCKELKIDFLSTPYNFEDVDLLYGMGVDGFKIASGQLTELPFIRYVAKKQKKIYLSTGMSTLSDIILAINEIKNQKNDNIVVLQCTTNYPSDVNDANLRCIETIKNSCNIEVGYSDHTTNNYSCFASVALGARVIEKHFTLDETQKGPDHSSSANPARFKDLVEGVREVEKSLGSSLKQITKSEQNNVFGMKRSLVITKDVNQNEVLTEQNVGFKRPMNGLHPNFYDLIIGQKANVNLKKDTPLQLNFINFE